MRAARIIGWSALAIVLALYLGLPLAMAVAAVWPGRAQVGEPPPGFREVSLTASDGVRLDGWYSPPRNGAAIVLAHGAGGSRESSRRLGAVLAERGYGVLALDLRGHGSSGGRTNRLGWQGSRDIRAAADYLIAHEEGVAIGGVGSSMGGEVLLGASASCPEMRAIVADGATRRCTNELLALPSKRSLVESFTPRVMYALVGLLSGERQPAPLLNEMRDATSTAFLLIAAGEEDLEIDFNERFSQALGRRATLWIVPGVTHTGAYQRYPDDYERRVLGFFDDRLIGK